MRTYRLGFGQTVVVLCTIAAVAGGVAFVLKAFGVF